jgi:hypothetical protein
MADQDRVTALGFAPDEGPRAPELPFIIAR